MANETKDYNLHVFSGNEILEALRADAEKRKRTALDTMTSKAKSGNALGAALSAIRGGITKAEIMAIPEEAVGKENREALLKSFDTLVIKSHEHSEK